MKFGLIRMPDAQPARDELTAAQSQLVLAETLGFNFAYLPKLSPDQIATSDIAQSTSRLRIGLDAASFGPLSLGDMEAAVRATNDAFHGRLRLGVEVCSNEGTTQRRVAAQNFETLFSQDLRTANTALSSRFPMKPPCPQIIGLPLKGTAQESGVAASYGYAPLTPSWLSTRAVAHHWPAIVAGATSALRRASPKYWQIARMVVIHDDPVVLQDYIFGQRSPIRRYYTQLAQRGLIAADINAQLKRLVIAGNADQVTRQILALQEAVGEIGALHILDPAGRDRDMTQNTLIRLAEDVIPKVQNGSTKTTKELENT